MLKYTGFGFPVFSGAGFVAQTGLLPLPVPITTVMGPPVQVTKWAGSTADPAFRAATVQLHATYMAALQKLYDDNKEQYHKHRQRDMQFVQ